MNVEELNIDVTAGSIYDAWEEDTLLYSLSDEDIKEFMDDYDIIKNLLLTQASAGLFGTKSNGRIVNKLNYVYEHLQSIYEGTCCEAESFPEYTWNRARFAIME
jgi:hypothetical protein